MKPFLVSTTPAGWFQRATADLAALISDHFHCERKAAENALGLVRKYPGCPQFVEPLMRLAHEETAHLIQVSVLLGERGLRLRADTPNTFARRLLAAVRPSDPNRKTDLLLVAALIEARSHERLDLLAHGFASAGDPRLADFYGALATAEDRHAELYFELATQDAPVTDVKDRLGILAEHEANVLASLPFAPRIH